MNNKIALASLAMDLKRVALGYHNGSIQMAERFLEEALKRTAEIDQRPLKKYLRQMLADIKKIQIEKDKQKTAEDALMYSVIFQNAALMML